MVCAWKGGKVAPPVHEKKLTIKLTLTIATKNSGFSLTWLARVLLSWQSQGYGTWVVVRREVRARRSLRREVVVGRKG